MKYTIGGVIKNVTEPRLVKTSKGSTFYSQDIWLAFKGGRDNERDEIAAFEVFQKEPVGDENRGQFVEVEFTITGRKYTSKKDGSQGVFTKLKAISVRPVKGTPTQRSSRQAPPVDELNDDDVPF